MEISLTRIILSCSLAGLVAYLAYRMRSLDLGGALAAFFVGLSIFMLGGLLGSVILLSFFITGSLLTQLPGISTQHGDKQGRSWTQVFANAFVPLGALYGTALAPALSLEWSLVFAGAFSTAAADTWATEIGSRYGMKTFSLTSLTYVRRGESGGVTVIGLVASLAGATMVGATVLLPLESGALRLPAETLSAVLLAGFAGSVLDSVAGSLIQARFHCSHCHEIVETRQHCGARTMHTRGLLIIDNSGVNLITCLAGGLIALLIYSS
jgi:uncharacterized protein (TIGR00297 family)